MDTRPCSSPRPPRPSLQPQRRSPRVADHRSDHFSLNTSLSDKRSERWGWRKRRWKKRSDNSGRSTTLFFCLHLLIGGQSSEQRQHLQPANICFLQRQSGREERWDGARWWCDKHWPDLHRVEPTVNNTCIMLRFVKVCKM